MLGRLGSAILVERTRALLDEDRGEEALGVALAASRHNPLCAALHFLRGLALDRAGDPTSAADAFARAIEVDKAHAPSYYHLGLLAQESGDRGSSRERFEDALSASAGLDENHAWSEWDRVDVADLRRLVFMQLGVDKPADMVDVGAVEETRLPARSGGRVGAAGRTRR